MGEDRSRGRARHRRLEAPSPARVGAGWARRAVLALLLSASVVSCMAAVRSGPYGVLRPTAHVVARGGLPRTLPASEVMTGRVPVKRFRTRVELATLVALAAGIALTGWRCVRRLTSMAAPAWDWAARMRGPPAPRPALR